MFLYGSGFYVGEYVSICNVIVLFIVLIYLMVLLFGFYRNLIIFIEGIKMLDIRNWVEGRG